MNSFHPVIPIPKNYTVFDFTKGYDHEYVAAQSFAVGKYNERRKNMYTSTHYKNERFIHMGIDLWCTAGTPVHSFWEGRIYGIANNDNPLDYGATIVTEHQFGDLTLYALFGHLSLDSLQKNSVGKKLSRGETFAWLGTDQENGGWIPHLHFQISFKNPGKPDMPGVVSEADHQEALELYPDPQRILGKLYE